MDMISLYRKREDMPGWNNKAYVLYGFADKDARQLAGVYVTEDLTASYKFEWDDEGQGWVCEKNTSQEHKDALIRGERDVPNLEDEIVDLQEELRSYPKRERILAGAFVMCFALGFYSALKLRGENS